MRRWPQELTNDARVVRGNETFTLLVAQSGQVLMYCSRSQLVVVLVPVVVFVAMLGSWRVDCISILDAASQCVCNIHGLRSQPSSDVLIEALFFGLFGFEGREWLCDEGILT